MATKKSNPEKRPTTRVVGGASQSEPIRAASRMAAAIANGYDALGDLRLQKSRLEGLVESQARPTGPMGPEATDAEVPGSYGNVEALEQLVRFFHEDLTRCRELVTMLEELVG